VKVHNLSIASGSLQLGKSRAESLPAIKYISQPSSYSLKTDEESKKYLWRKEWSEYWPEGWKSSDYVPIKIEPVSIEYYNKKDKEFLSDGYAPIIINLGKTSKK